MILENIYNKILDAVGHKDEKATSLGGVKLLHYSFFNRPFPNYLLPLFQNKASYSIIHMQMNLFCIGMKSYNHMKG